MYYTTLSDIYYVILLQLHILFTNQFAGCPVAAAQGTLYFCLCTVFCGKPCAQCTTHKHYE